MDDNNLSTVIRFARSLGSELTDLSVSELSSTNQTSSTLIINPPAPSSSNGLEKQNKKGRVKVGAEFQLEKEDGEMECGLCKKVFATKKGLKIHMRLHYGIKPFQCSLCPKAFTQSSVLQSHIAYHTGRRDWVCDICNKAFTQSAHLSAHRKSHSAQKDYQCPHCQRRFSTKARCDVHVRQHTGERDYRYACLLCDDKCFTRSDALRSHENAVHRGFRPYFCPELGCGKTFCRPSGLKRHIRSKHTAPESDPAAASTRISVDC